MNKKLTCLIALIIIGLGIALADIEHTVTRGESIESIAEKYGITTEKLIEVNKDALTLFYIGQRLTIPIVEEESGLQSDYTYTSSVRRMISPNELYLEKEAKQHFENENWSKAAKIYGKLIKNYPKSIYYYNRALSNFNNNKNRQAANDFKKALAMDDCTPSMRENGPELLAEAERRHSQWKDNQYSAIGEILLQTAAVGLNTWAAVESSRQMQTFNENMYSAPMSYYGNKVTDEAYINYGLQQIAVQTLQEEQNKYERFRAMWKSTTGEDLSFSDYINITCSGDNAGTTTTQTSTDNYKQRRIDNLNAAAGPECGLCHGTGKCHACNGTKIAHSFGLEYACTVCNKNGDCPQCGGTGRASWNR